MSHLSKFCGEKAHSRQQINDAPFERGISNGKAACGMVSRVHRVVLGESRAIRTLPAKDGVMSGLPTNQPEPRKVSMLRLK
jgi:hypothetical protein